MLLIRPRRKGLPPKPKRVGLPLTVDRTFHLIMGCVYLLLFAIGAMAYIDKQLMYLLHGIGFWGGVIGLIFMGFARFGGLMSDQEPRR